MIAKFNLSALGTRNVHSARPAQVLFNEKKEDEDKNEEESKELNRYMLARLICKLLNDYSEGPDFVEEEHNFGTLKSLTEDDWEDILKKIEDELDEKYDVDVKITTTYKWTQKDGREIKEFIDKIWSLVEGGDEDTDEEEPEDDDDDTKEEEEDTSDSEESYRGFLWNKKDDDKDDDEEDLLKEDEAEAPSEDDENGDEDDADKKSSKDKKDKEEDDEDTDEEDDESDSDEEDEKDEDSDDEEDDEDSDDEEEDDDDKSSKSKKDKKDKDEDDEDEDEDDKSESKKDKDDKEEDESEDDEDEDDEKSEKSEEILRTCASKYPIPSWNSNLFAKDLKQLDLYHNYLRHLDVSSNEGIGTGLLKIFIGVTDVFLKIGNTFKTNIFKFYKDLKRSEMRYYYESHTTMCLKAESLPITQLTSIQVPIPSGMQGTYQNACMTLQQAYEMLDILSYGQGVLAALIDFRRKLTRSEDYKSTLVPMTNLVNQRGNSLNNLKSTVDKVFTQKNTPMEVKFTDVYKTMKEFKDTRLSLLGMETYLANTNRLVKLVDDIDTVLADITSYLTEDKEVDKALVNDMINIVRYMGVSFDIYGATSTKQMAVEHNHIGAIGRVWSTIK